MNPSASSLPSTSAGTEPVDWQQEFQQGTTLPSPTVSQLIQQTKIGCEISRGQLFTILRSYFKTLAERHHHECLKVKAGVSDIVQQSMLRAVEGFAGFEGKSEGELKGWLKTLLLNEVRQTARGWRRQRRDIRREVRLNPPLSGNDWELKDPCPTPQSFQLQQEQTDELRRALGRLPQLDRQVIHLRVWERQPFDQIGQQIDRSADAAAKIWYRAIVKLQRELNRQSELNCQSEANGLVRGAGQAADHE